MKKLLVISSLLVSIFVFSAAPMVASASTVKKTVSKTKTVTAKTTMKWDASALKIINNPASFDRSMAIRNAYAKKVESYAKRNKIKVITAKVINGMRE
jgi:hypothetical protein